MYKESKIAVQVATSEVPCAPDWSYYRGLTGTWLKKEKRQQRPKIPIHEVEHSSAPLQPCCLEQWSQGRPVVGGGRCVDRGGKPWVSTQSKAPFNSHEAFMNRHLPPLLSIPLTAALPLPSSSLSFFFFILHTLCPSFWRPLCLSFSYTLPCLIHTHTYSASASNRFSSFHSEFVCVRISCVCFWVSLFNSTSRVYVPVLSPLGLQVNVCAARKETHTHKLMEGAY